MPRTYISFSLISTNLILYGYGRLEQVKVILIQVHDHSKRNIITYQKKKANIIQNFFGLPNEMD